MERSETIRGPKRPAPAISDKFQARLDRVKMLEHEQQMEDLEALKHTPEDLRILQESFAAVKAEFVDLDGQSWDTPAAREMLVNWHEQQATRELPACLSPDGLRLRKHQRRRSLAAVVSPAASVDNISVSLSEGAVADDIVRGRPTEVSTPASRTVHTTPKLHRMRRESHLAVAPSAGDDNDTDVSQYPARAGLVVSSAGSHHPPDPHAMSRLHTLLAKVAMSGDSVSADSAASPFTPASSIASGGGPRPGLAPAAASTPRTSTIMLSNSPTLNQSLTFSDSPSAGVARAGPLRKRRNSRSTSVIVSGDIDPDDVENVLHRYFPGVQVKPVVRVDSVAGPGQSRQVTAKPASPRLGAPAGAARRRPRGRRIPSGDSAGMPMIRASLLFAGRAGGCAGSGEDDDGGEGVGVGPVPLVRTISSMGWSPSDL
ncbi:hypothetical protein OH76DRAFT_1411177 [Lentinus brumalis]|uniref:Uncharacterized protein n=1 Tax=Lentinus brumalis TaxID=2498619 RepID=A0A371CQ42_9APHY|nr:hypothetical protein OH76DRAFT_1411177 [Polyporus brumalis]